MVWGPKRHQSGPVPAGAAPSEATRPGAFRLRDALIIVIGNIVGQLAGALFYAVQLAIYARAGSSDILLSLMQLPPYRNHLILVSGLTGYLFMLPWVLHLLRKGRITLSSIGFRWPGARWFVYAVLAFVALKGLSIWLMSYLDEETIKESYQTMEGIVGTGMLWTLLSAALVVVAAPLLEEMAFRGALYQGLSRHMPRLAAAILATLAFAAIHVQYALAGGMAAIVTTSQVAALGAVLMFLYMKSRSLWPGIALHALNNGVSLIFLFATMQH